MIRERTVEGELWQAVVRRDIRNGRQLERLHVEPCGVVVAAPGQGTLLIDVVSFLDANLIGLQILEVVRIADVGVVDLTHQTRIQTTLVLPVDHPASVFVICLQLALIVLIVEVRAAELAFA